jgi:hypothetical protein
MAGPRRHTTVRVTATGGMPGWQVTLIAAIAAILAAATAVLPGRATPPGGTPQRQPLTPQPTPNRARPHSPTASPTQSSPPK